MRGIAGLIRFDGQRVGREEVSRILDAMAIFSPDRVDLWHEDGAGLGRCSKIVTPEDRFETSLPISSAAPFVLVADAVLTNRDELAVAFGWSAAEAAQRADSAFVQAAYEKWGVSTPTRLDGQFAFAVWHPRERRFFGAVDALGFRPLYYWNHRGTFAFATTLRALFALPDVSRALNETVFAEGFLGLDRVTEATLYRDVNRILRGHSLVIEGGEVRTTRYWWPGTAPLRLGSDKEYLEAFRAELTRAVKSSLRTRGAIGLMLSGGLDSSAIGAVADEILAGQGRRLQAIHLVPPQPERHRSQLHELDETSYVRDLQPAFPHTDFHFFPSTPQPLLTEEEVARYFDEQQVPAHGLLMRSDPALKALFDRLQIGELLNGYGGNILVSLETWGSGYMGYLAASGRWLTLIREIQGHHRFYGTARRVLLRETFEDAGWLRPSPPPESMRLRLLHPDHPARRRGAERIREAREPVTPRQARDLRGKWLESLLDDLAQHTGISGAAISRDAGSFRPVAPMFDRRLNEFCLRLAPSQQFRHGQDRRVLREVMRDRLPERIRLRTTRGFPVPIFQSAFSLHRASLIGSMQQLVADPVITTWFNPETVLELMTKLQQPSVTLREENVATSFVGWARFLSWRARSS